jgi:hypothetical protein
VVVLCYRRLVCALEPVSVTDLVAAAVPRVLLRACNTDPRNGSMWYNTELRVKMDILLVGIGKGSTNLSYAGQKMVSFYGRSFSKMIPLALIIYGDQNTDLFS